MNTVGWRLEDEAPDLHMLLFLRAQPPSGGRQVWARYEYSTDQSRGFGPYRSLVELYQVDCKAMTYTVLQSRFFAGSGATGKSTEGPPDPTPQHANPNSFTATAVGITCGTMKAL